jgi:serine/threonine-protein kinase
VALGCAAFGIARAIKAEGPRRAEPSRPLAAPAPAPGDTSASAAIPSAPVIVAERPAPAALPPSAGAAARPRSGPTTFVPPSPLPPPTPPPSGNRHVKFLVNPQGAKLLVDGQPINWFGGTVSLPPGAHQVTAFMEGSKEGAKCCKTLETSVMVQAPPADNLEQVQSIPLALEILPASVTLTGAPPNGQYVCPSINLSGFPGSTVKVKLNEPVWTGKCQFTTSNDKPGRPHAVSLRAGEMNAIAWPVD